MPEEHDRNTESTAEEGRPLAITHDNQVQTNIGSMASFPADLLSLGGCQSRNQLIIDRFHSLFCGLLNHTLFQGFRFSQFVGCNYLMVMMKSCYYDKLYYFISITYQFSLFSQMALIIILYSELNSSPIDELWEGA